MRNPFQILVVLTAIFGLGLGAAFAGGAWWERRNAPDPAPAAQASPAPAGLPAGVGAAAGGAAAQATTGVVEGIEGDTVTIRTQAGGTVAVKVQGDTQLRQLAPAAQTDLRPGLTVIVQGTPDIDGKVAARSVQITGMGGPGASPGAAGGQAPRPSGARPPSPSPAP